MKFCKIEQTYKQEVNFMNNKIIVIEGTDCSGKQTQTEMLMERLNKEGVVLNDFHFPCYDSPTGFIIGRDYLGKPQMGEGVFPEGASNVDPKVSSLYYIADRLYNLPKIKNLLVQGHVIIDRYSFSNFGHQAGKYKNKKDRIKMFRWLEQAEFKLCKLPKPDIKILLYMPYEYAVNLRKGRTELPDQNEINPEHLKNAERTYLELAKIYRFKIINCVENNQVKTKQQISDEVYEYVCKKLRHKSK